MVNLFGVVLVVGFFDFYVGVLCFIGVIIVINGLIYFFLVGFDIGCGMFLVEIFLILLFVCKLRILDWWVECI